MSEPSQDAYHIGDCIDHLTAAINELIKAVDYISTQLRDKK